MIPMKIVVRSQILFRNVLQSVLQKVLRSTVTAVDNGGKGAVGQVCCCECCVMLLESKAPEVGG